MKLVFISDTHNQHDFEVPEGDILVHCGDLTTMGTFSQVLNALTWVAELPFKDRVVIAGNHDFLFQNSQEMGKTAVLQAKGHVKTGQLHYLQDSGIEIEGLRFWGSPWTPRFYDWAFQLGHEHPADKHWDRVPERVDVLITHGPPRGILDMTPRGEAVGDEALFWALRNGDIKPKIHAFGHIHHCGGQVAIRSWPASNPLFVNAAVCDEFYCPTQKPVVVEL
jgi:predicted phosphohydrolase